MKKGQALVTLLIFMVMAIAVTTAAVIMIVANTTSGSRVERGQAVAQAAESGAETGLIKLIRNPFYTGESFIINEIDVTVNVTGSGVYTIESVATENDFERRIEIVVDYTDNTLDIVSWKEEF